MEINRRGFLKTAVAAMAGGLGAEDAFAQRAGTSGGIAADDRVLVANEESNTLSVIDPARNAVVKTINLTSFDEDPRPLYRFATAGRIPTYAAMIRKPLYRGCIFAHGMALDPDGTLLAVSGRGSSNVYLIDTLTYRVLGSTPNPQAGAATNPERISSGVLVGREPVGSAFTRNGKELWVALRGEDRIAIIDTVKARTAVGGKAAGAVRAFLQTVYGPAQVAFSRDGTLAFVVSQRVPRVDVIGLNADDEGYSKPQRVAMLDISLVDKHGDTPFLKHTPDGAQAWLVHELADAVSVIAAGAPFHPLVTVPLGAGARPNQIEFVENDKGRVAYVTLARVESDPHGGVAASRIAIIDRSVPAAQTKVVKTFSSRGRAAHGLWANPAHTLLYVAHEGDEMPGTPNAGQTVCSVFDIARPLEPQFVAQIPLGHLALPSGNLRSKKGVGVVYVHRAAALG